MRFQDKTYIKAQGVYYGGILKAVKKHKNPLQPIYEAFTNALESINLLSSKEDNGCITIKVHYKKNLIDENEFSKIIIEDTGIGFNDKEFERFNTYKDDRKGYNNKGSGRLQLIHYFQNCEYVSVFQDGDDFKERIFSISKADRFIQENAITFLESTKKAGNNSRLTSLSLSNLLNDKDKEHYAISIDDIKEKLITHYIQYFCSHRETLPTIKLQAFINNVEEREVDIKSEDIPEVDNTAVFNLKYHRLAADGKSIIETNNQESFTIKAFRIPKEKLDRNAIKLTSKDEIVESNEFKMSLASLSPEDHIGDDRFLFLVSSAFINERDDDRRGELKIPRRDTFKKEYNLFSEEEIFLDDIEQSVNDKIVSMYDEIRNKTTEKEQQIDDLKEMFLLNEEVLKDIAISLNDSEERILEKVYTAESKLIAKGDYEIKRKIDALENLNPNSADYQVNFEEAINEIVKEIPLQNRVALTHYVARRKLVLELFDKILNKKLTVQQDAKRNLDEKLIHNLLFKQKSHTPDTSDLWLINEDFILFQGTSESKLKDIKYHDIKILKEILTEEETKYRDALDEKRYDKRPDVLLFPEEGKCIIIEFKAPDVNIGEHLNQINRYATLIRNLSKDEYQFDTFYGYLVGESIDADDVRDFDADFKNAPHFDYVFRPFKTIAGKFGRKDGALYTEIIKYSTLLQRATKRNNVFIDKLWNEKEEGGSVALI